MSDETISAEKSIMLTLLAGAILCLSTLPLLSACSRQSGKPQPAAFSAPTPPCNRDAQVLTQAQPEWPEEVRTTRVHEAQVAIRVHISSTGRLKSARIIKSSGVPALDIAALSAADRSTYEPAAKNCKSSAGSYIFRVTFSANG